MLKNLDIRIMVSDAGLRYKAIAGCIGVSPEYLSRLMKEELSAGNRIRIIKAIETLKEQEA